MPQGPGPREIIKKDGEFVVKEVNSTYFPIDGKRKNITDFANVFRNLAQTSHFEVSFSGFGSELKNYLNGKGIDNDFIANNLGLLCYNAVIPTSSSTTVITQGNRTGIVEQFAHTRTYDSLQLSFYVDRKYKVLRFFENWMSFIHSGSSFDEIEDDFFVRNQYPADYKINLLKIHKFDRDYKNVVPYTFKGIFPTGVIPLQVDYSSSDILKLNVIFSYERYVQKDIGVLELS